MELLHHKPVQSVRFAIGLVVCPLGFLLPPERLGQIADFVDFLTTQEQRRKAGEELRAMWARMPQEDLTEAIEQEIVAEVRAVRAEP